MLAQLATGSVVIALTVAVQAELFNLFSNHLEPIILLFRRWLRRFANTGVMIVAVLFVLFVQTVNVWLWAMTFLLVGAIDGLEPALYFTLVAFTTVGFGDITLGPDWRLMSGLTAANGFLTFGWSAAYMVELVRRTL